MSRTWILTGSPENHRATRAHGFGVIGFKERNRKRALQIQPGDRIVLYATGVMAFAGSVRVEGEMYEDHSRIWAWSPDRPDPYPWRFPTSPEAVLEESEWIPAESFVGALDHIAKWPPRHWTFAFACTVRSGAFRPNAEIVEIGYFAPDEVQRLISPRVRPLIDMALRRRAARASAPPS